MSKTFLGHIFVSWDLTFAVISGKDHAMFGFMRYSEVAEIQEHIIEKIRVISESRKSTVIQIRTAGFNEG